MPGVESAGAVLSTQVLQDKINAVKQQQKDNVDELKTKKVAAKIVEQEGVNAERDKQAFFSVKPLTPSNLELIQQAKQEKLVVANKLTMQEESEKQTNIVEALRAQSENTKQKSTEATKLAVSEFERVFEIATEEQDAVGLSALFEKQGFEETIETLVRAREAFKDTVALTPDIAENEARGADLIEASKEVFEGVNISA